MQMKLRFFLACKKGADLKVSLRLNWSLISDSLCVVAVGGA